MFTVLTLDLIVILSLATEAGIAEPWYLPSFLVVVAATYLTGATICLIAKRKNRDQWEQLSGTDDAKLLRQYVNEDDDAKLLRQNEDDDTKLLRQNLRCNP